MAKKVRAVVRLNQGGQFNFVMDNAVRSAMVAGIGSGKSEALKHKILRRIDQNHKVMTRRYPALYMAPTYMQIENLVPALEEQLMTYGIPFKPARGDNRRMEIRYRGHWCHLLLVSAENYDRYMGLGCPFIAADEMDLCFNGNVDKIRRMYEKMTGRARVLGATNSFDTVCSPEGFGFMWETWVDKPAKSPALRADYTLHRATTWSNYKNLAPGYIEKLKRDFPPQLVRAYLEGEFVPLGQGLAYTEFDRQVHTDITKICYYPQRALGLCWDFNVNPMVVTAVQRDPEKRHYMGLRTHELPNSTTHRMCQHLIEEWGDHKGPVVIYGDSTSNQHRSSGAGKSDREIIDQILGRYFAARGGYETRWTNTNPLQRDRVNTVNGMLKTFDGHVRFYVHPENCLPLINDFLRQGWKPGGVDLDSQGETVGHAAAGVGYFMWREHPLKRQPNIRTAA